MKDLSRADAVNNHRETRVHTARDRVAERGGTGIPYDSTTPPQSRGETARPYDADELEFLKAADALRRKKRRLLALSELLGVLKGLGWRKAG